jgi:hypothetical protein
MAKKRNIATSVIGLILIGSIGLINLTQRPRFANFHTVDVLQLVATGMCYGVALALIGLLRKGSTE